jgi:hypothetical protein
MTDDLEEPPSWMDFLIYSYRTAHEFTAARIRKKLSVNSTPDALMAQADEIVWHDIGSYPSEERYDPYSDPEEDARLEADMRKIALRNYNSLLETESYMWGLGIAGIFHQWDRDTRQAVKHYHTTPPDDVRLSRLKFDDLCTKVEETGFRITADPAYYLLRLGYLVSNTIKHGEGPAFRELLRIRPNLFSGALTEEGSALPVRADHLRVGQPEYDAIADAIKRIWWSYDMIV